MVGVDHLERRCFCHPGLSARCADLLHRVQKRVRRVIRLATHSLTHHPSVHLYLHLYLISRPVPMGEHSFNRNRTSLRMKETPRRERVNA